jgi:hypothetical protein
MAITPNRSQSLVLIRACGTILCLAMAAPRYVKRLKYRSLLLVKANFLKADSVFSGISTFGRLPYFPCLASDDVKYDIAFIGAYNIDRCFWLT